MEIVILHNKLDHQIITIKKESLLARFAPISNIAKIIILAMLLFMHSGCGAEKAAPCNRHNPCYQFGHKDGYTSGHHHGHAKGYAEAKKEWYKKGKDAGYRAFVKDHWMPTLAGVTLGGLIVLSLIPIWFLIKYRFRVATVNYEIRSYLKSAKNIQMINPEQEKLIKDLERAQDIKQKVTNLLDNKMTCELAVEDVRIRTIVKEKAKKIEIDLKNTVVTLLSLKDEVEFLASLTGLKKESYRKMVSKLLNNNRISPHDKLVLMNKINNHYLT